MLEARQAGGPPFHFVFGLRTKNEPFHLMHYLCLRSCRNVHPTSEIYFHYRNLPHGRWWDQIAPELILRQVDESTPGFNPTLYQNTSEGRFIDKAGLSYAHEADFIRLQALLQYGGVYADMDTLFVRPYPSALFQHDCVLGEEVPVPDPHTGILRPSLCNALIMGHPGSPFLADWLELAKEAFDGTWSRHSCQAASLMWSHSPDRVHVAPWWWFHGFPATSQGLKNLFEENAPIPEGLCSIHLLAHLWWSPERTDFSTFHAGLLNESYVRNAATTYARLARQHMEPGPPEQTPPASR